MRQVLPELLDVLAHDDPVARESREELGVFNRIMGNHRWVCRVLNEHVCDHHRVLELGAGDGELAQHAWKQGAATPAQWSSLDLAPMPVEWPDDATWLQRDLFQEPSLPDAEVVVANLFLHQFQDEQLAELGRCLPDSCRLFVACEPARHWVHAWQGRLVSAIVGLNYVTYHDMLVSIRAGFAGDELHQAMRLEHWQWKVSRTAFGAYRFTAWR